MTNTESGATVPEGTVKTIPSRPQGVCLMEIWPTADKRAPSHFWREMQADGVFSLWRFMEPSFAKKALRARTFTLDKDQHVVTYAAKRVDVRALTLDDYERVKTLRHAFRVCPDPALLCKSCQGSKVIQATQRTDAATVRRFEITCPECAPKPTGRVFRIVEEVPGIVESERYYVTGPDLPPVNFSTHEAARAFLKGIGAGDDEIRVEPFEP